MSVEKHTAHAVNDLIEIARDGESFYRDAAEKVKDAELASLFSRIAGTKADIVNRLTSVVAASRAASILVRPSGVRSFMLPEQSSRTTRSVSSSSSARGRTARIASRIRGSVTRLGLTCPSTMRLRASAKSMPPAAPSTEPGGL